jgi:tetratricopeptide repeat protein 8
MTFLQALELANQALALDSANNNGDEFYWKCAVNRCLMRLGLVREVIQGTNSDWYSKANCSEGIRLMAKSYVMMDQPLAAVDIYLKGIEKFPKETSLLLGIARYVHNLY